MVGKISFGNKHTCLLFMMFLGPVLFPVTSWRRFSERLVVFLPECCSTCQLGGNLEIFVFVRGLLFWDSARLIFVAGGRRSTKCVVVFRAACCAEQRGRLLGWRGSRMEVWPLMTSLEYLVLYHGGGSCSAAFFGKPAWRVFSCCNLRKNCAVLRVRKFSGRTNQPAFFSAQW